MYIDIGNEHGYASFTPEAFEKFRNHVIKGEKVQAIMYMREMLPSWSLLEAKNFVDACTFKGPHMVTTTDTKTRDFLSEIKDDLRSIILDKSDYRESLLLILYGRVSGKVGTR